MLECVERAALKFELEEDGEAAALALEAKEEAVDAALPVAETK
jgi:hypothetical protein